MILFTLVLLVGTQDKFKYCIKESSGLYFTLPFAPTIFDLTKLLSFPVYFTSCSSTIGQSLGVMYTCFSELFNSLLMMIVNPCRSLSVIHNKKGCKKHLVGKYFVKMIDHACLFQVSPCGVIAMICYVSCHLYLRKKL